ncbi:MAG: hypothetical protein JXA20_10615 [Spirochaetes bacterium]|nr:hypothetical protein [Spirochaetota bacterium]
MGFTLPRYRPPDLTVPPLHGAPAARFEAAPADGVVPEGFHSTSNYPEYVKLEGGWALCPAGRMDCVTVLDSAAANGRSPLRVAEFRNVKKGDPVLLGRSEDGSEGIYVHDGGFVAAESSGDKFQFKTRITRETPFSRDYDQLYELLRHEREHGFITLVMGPAVAFDRDSRDAVASLISHGFCHAVLAGNALATHDLEADMFGTALGQDIYTKRNVPAGHYHHLELLNRVRRCGSMDAAVREYGLGGGIVGACLERRIPLVLAGSIRDDGPLPEVIGDAYRGQDAMREIAVRTTTAIALATQLHSIAFGNMLPSYRAEGDAVRPVYFYIVDISEFAVDKLANRGSFQAMGISTNVQDFCVNLRRALIGP